MNIHILACYKNTQIIQVKVRLSALEYGSLNVKYAVENLGIVNKNEDVYLHFQPSINGTGISIINHNPDVRL